MDIMKLKSVSEPGWTEIEKLGWGTWSSDYEKVWTLMHKLYTPETIKQLRRFASGRVAELYKRIEEWESNNDTHLNIGSDDGLNDVTWHVVGMGETEFKRVIEEPYLLEMRYNAERGSFEGYQESFAYCFHESL